MDVKKRWYKLEQTLLEAVYIEAPEGHSPEEGGWRQFATREEAEAYFKPETAKTGPMLSAEDLEAIRREKEGTKSLAKMDAALEALLQRLGAESV